MGKHKDDLAIVDIRITAVEHIPAKYFTAKKVLDALSDEILNDVINNHARVPAGTEKVLGAPSSGILREQSTRLFWRNVKIAAARDAHILITIYLAIATAAIFSIVWGWTV